MAISGAVVATAMSDACLVITAIFTARVNTDGAMAVLKEVSDIVIPSFFAVVFATFAILTLIDGIPAISIAFLISFPVDFTLMAIPISLTILALSSLSTMMMALIDAIFMTENMPILTPSWVITISLSLLFAISMIETMNTTIFTHLLGDLTVVAVPAIWTTTVGLFAISAIINAITYIVAMVRSTGIAASFLVFATGLTILIFAAISALLPIPFSLQINTMTLGLRVIVRIFRTGSGQMDTRESLRLLHQMRFI
ncbi:hypothetical protein N7509_013159 [Penicillium cosmopolitanum]|uniref:Uncharacterized protein n=1 Tax=Penicillium cosmopolitanum TaxID=1131564 RepID=A0A9W9SHG8_9EURO|nr:uncharacterized protein N7509_013159 [Penicillium cosmopolitanum]KAJ5376273.1 hypothetical protein N7509_013159 [Penicillium cosmopolitanum]